jgi:hypothetical protein
MKVVADTGKQCNLILGDTNTFVIPRNAPQGRRRRGSITSHIRLKIGIRTL